MHQLSYSQSCLSWFQSFQDLLYILNLFCCTVSCNAIILYLYWFLSDYMLRAGKVLPTHPFGFPQISHQILFSTLPFRGVSVDSVYRLVVFKSLCFPSKLTKLPLNIFAFHSYILNGLQIHCTGIFYFHGTKFHFFFHPWSQWKVNILK